MKTKETIRPYRPGDEERILRLRGEVFTSRMDEALFKWKFLEHPRGLGWMKVAEEGSEIIGFYGMTRQYLNFLGEEVRGGQVGDIMVRGDRRGKGLFLKLAGSVYNTFSRDDPFVSYGFPNRQSYPAVTKYLDYARICNMDFYQYRAGMTGIAGKTLGLAGRLFRGLKVWLRCEINARLSMKRSAMEMTADLPAGLSDLLKEINTYEVLSLWKDEDYLRWRYVDHPRHRYDIFPLRVNGVLEGLVVARRDGTRAVICEILNRTKNVQQAFLHLLYVQRRYIFSGMGEVIFLGHDNGFFETVFGRSGFKKSMSNIVCTVRFSGRGRIREMFMIPENWTFVYGDSDLI
ncbi:MAG: GNAT family N-acetyltransferase [Spirochaetes bacterium]|nr:GNAT family N-acetyltransferase [Spirochaetota bacterium]